MVCPEPLTPMTPSPVFEYLFGNGLTLVAGTWCNHRIVGVLINCREPPVSVSAHVRHITQTRKWSLIGAFAVCRSTRWPVAAWSTHPFAGGTSHTFSLPLRHASAFSCSKARQIVIGGMSKIRVKTSQGCLRSWCQSFTVAWIQLGVVEGSSPWGQMWVLMDDPQHEHTKDFFYSVFGISVQMQEGN